MMKRLSFAYAFLFVTAISSAQAMEKEFERSINCFATAVKTAVAPAIEERRSLSDLWSIDREYAELKELVTIVHEYRIFTESKENFGGVTLWNFSTTCPKSLKGTELFHYLLERQKNIYSSLVYSPETFAESLENMIKKSVIQFLRNSDSTPVKQAWQDALTKSYPEIQKLLTLVGDTYMPTYMAKSVLSALLLRDAEEGSAGKICVYQRNEDSPLKTYQQELRQKMVSTLTFAAWAVNDGKGVRSNSLLKEISQWKQAAVCVIKENQWDAGYDVREVSPKKIQPTTDKIRAFLESDSEMKEYLWFRALDNNALTVGVQLCLTSYCVEKELNQLLDVTKEMDSQIAPLLYSIQENELELLKALQVI